MSTYVALTLDLHKNHSTTLDLDPEQALGLQERRQILKRPNVHQLQPTSSTEMDSLCFMHCSSTTSTSSSEWLFSSKIPLA